MLTPKEQTLLTWFREFQKTGGNQLTLARKDIAVVVGALERLGVDAPAPEAPALPPSNVVTYRPKLCADCHVEFGPTVVPRAMVVGKGPVCQFCADRRGIK